MLSVLELKSAVDRLAAFSLITGDPGGTLQGEFLSLLVAEIL